MPSLQCSRYQQEQEQDWRFSQQGQPELLLLLTGAAGKNAPPLSEWVWVLEEVKLHNREGEKATKISLCYATV